MRCVRGGLLGALCLALAGLCMPSQGHAFELFGIKLFGSDDEDADIVDPLNYTVTVTIDEEDKALRKALEGASSLVQEADRPVSGSLGLLTKARSDREQIVAALYAQARYDGVVTISIEGTPIDDLPPDAEFSRGGPVPVTIAIDPGLVYTLGAIALGGDAGGLAPAEFGLVPGGDARSGAILKAEAEIVRRLKEEGRPLATVTGRDIVANHPTATLDVSVSVAAGPVAPFGETTVTGTQEVDRAFTEYMADLEPGRAYSPKEIDDARDRLVGLGVFSSVSIKEGTSLDPTGRLPVQIEVSERKMRYYGFGGTISNTDGAGVEGYWGHRNLFGRAEKLRIEGSVSGIGAKSDVNAFSLQQLEKLNYNAAVMFEKPGVIGSDSKFFANLRTVFEHPDAYDRFSVKASAGVSYELSNTQSVSAELALEYARIKDAFDPDGTRFFLASIPLQYVFDNRDNKLNPTRGIRALAYAEPTYDFLNSAIFLKARGEGSAYWGLDEDARYVLAGRIAGGSILGASLGAVPADRRFYSGGGGSVRGYAYQGIGPKDINGKPTGGLSYLETSLELRYAFNDTLGIVPFIDAGTVSEKQFPDFSDFKVGAGLGIRYLTPFGPLRIDAAVPLNPGPGDPDFGIYAGVGQAF